MIGIMLLALYWHFWLKRPGGGVETGEILTF